MHRKRVGGNIPKCYGIIVIFTFFIFSKMSTYYFNNQEKNIKIKSFPPKYVNQMPYIYILTTLRY